jgi:hypothetical protein
LRTLAEILDGHPTDPLIIWNYSPQAGIWNQFDKDLEAHGNLIYCRDRIWSCQLSNVDDVKGLKKGRITSEEIDTTVLGVLEKHAQPGVEGVSLFNVVTNVKDNTTYDLDFESDYSLRFQRRSFLLKKDGQPLYILSISNYPTWASFNKGHDWVYLFELNANVKLSPEEEGMLFSTIKEITYKNGGIANRIGLVSSKNSFSVGLEYINILFKPQALEYAARTVERI